MDHQGFGGTEVNHMTHRPDQELENLMSEAPADPGAQRYPEEATEKPPAQFLQMIQERSSLVERQDDAILSPWACRRSHPL